MGGASHNTYGYAVYKLEFVSNDVERFIYIDFRDNDYASTLPTAYTTDLSIEYDHLGYENGGFFRWRFNNQNDYVEIPDQGILQIWKGVNRNTPRTDEFPSDFWSNCLALGFHPVYSTFLSSLPLQVIWSKNPNQDNISKYYLYREIDEGDFTKIGEYNYQTFNYKDKSLLYEDIIPHHSVSYYVTSYNGMESTPTNIATEDYFINFDWSNGLILTKSGNHPKLVWVPNNTVSNLTGYKIYRKVDDEPFYYMGSLGINTFTYTDGEVNLNVKESAIQYYVAATNGAQEDPTNTVTAIGDYNPHKENQQGEELSELKYFLSDNFPNPFNPNTSISYSIPENAFVSLKIYDVLGNEVVELINEQKAPGNYQIDFNASELSSGIYYYTLTAGNFISTKKMSLIK